MLVSVGPWRSALYWSDTQRCRVRFERATRNVWATRFPLPWSVEELDACFVVRDHNGQQLAYVYFEDEQGEDRQ
jgi:hypothetical protein